jgi:hypothetical protein
VSVLSPAYLTESRYGGAEWLAAWPDDPDGMLRRIVPVRVEECSPDGLLRAITVVDLVGCDEATAADRLFTGLRIVLYATLDEGRNPDGRPTLLALSMPGRADDLMLRRVAVLWHRTLDESSLTELALDCLRDWVESAEADDDAARETLAQIVRASLRTGRDVRRMRSAFTRWRRHFPNAAEQVLVTIESFADGLR